MFIQIVNRINDAISAKDKPGIRFDAYKIDYGCYVDLISTSRYPQKFLFNDDLDHKNLEVPQDDYRSIRNAILDLEKFYTSIAG